MGMGRPGTGHNNEERRGRGGHGDAGEREGAHPLACASDFAHRWRSRKSTKRHAVSLHGDIGGYFRGGICAVPSTNEGAGRRRSCGGAAQAMAEDDSGRTTSLAHSLPLLIAQRLCNLSSRFLQHVVAGGAVAAGNKAMLSDVQLTWSGCEGRDRVQEAGF